MATRDACAWCECPIPEGARRDAICCSKRCRQARHRFIRAVGRGVASSSSTALKLAYADPPYPGLAGYYADHPDFAGEVDHGELVSRLASTYDGWALSTSAAALPDVLALCPRGVRIASWHRGARMVPHRGPLNGWEPVIYFGGRAGDAASSLQTRRLDTLTLDYRAGVRRTDPRRVIGAKPAAFARWMFDLIGAEPCDHLDDLYPGSGGIARAWDVFCGRSG